MRHPPAAQTTLWKINECLTFIMIILLVFTFLPDWVRYDCFPATKSNPELSIILPNAFCWGGGGRPPTTSRSCLQHLSLSLRVRLHSPETRSFLGNLAGRLSFQRKLLQYHTLWINELFVISGILLVLLVLF